PRAGASPVASRSGRGFLFDRDDQAGDDLVDALARRRWWHGLHEIATGARLLAEDPLLEPGDVPATEPLLAADSPGARIGSLHRSGAMLRRPGEAVEIAVDRDAPGLLEGVEGPDDELVRPAEEVVPEIDGVEPLLRHVGDDRVGREREPSADHHG